jgi:putative methanogen marker protein 4
MHSIDILKNVPDAKVGIGMKNCTEYPGAKVYNDPEALISDLKNGRIDAAVRGDMSSSELLPILKREFSLNDIQRTVLLEPAGKKLVFIAPVGIDEGWTAEQKYELAVNSVELMKRMGMGTRIAIMSGGRNADLGRSKEVDRTINDAGTLVKRLTSEGYDVYCSEILIENAVDDADLIIAPDGISGNLLFRSLHFLGGAKALGAPVLNMKKVFVDTSRAKVDYTDSIALAKRLSEVRK